jgi:5-methylcytosine-specific restriction endonuclease McrA
MKRRCHHCGRRVAVGNARDYGPEYRRLREMVLARDGYVCQLDRPGCTGYATTVDHIIPVSRGGTATLGNLRAACDHCNSGRRDRD